MILNLKLYLPAALGTNIRSKREPKIKKTKVKRNITTETQIVASSEQLERPK